MSEIMKILDLGCGRKKTLGAIGIDVRSHEGVDIIHDLNETPYPVNGPFDEIVLSHSLEHLRFSGKAIDEVIRLLDDGGTITITVPSERCRWYAWVEHHYLFRCYGRRGHNRNLPKIVQKLLGMIIPNEYVIEIRKNAPPRPRLEEGVKCPRCRRELKTRREQEFVEFYGACDNCVESDED